MRVTAWLVVPTLLVVHPPLPAAAQAHTEDADTREVLAYRLTMPKLRQLNAALADLQRQRAADPAYQALQKKKQELAALSEKEELTEAEQARMARLEEEIEAAEEADDVVEDEAQSLSEMAERLAADPRIAAALAKAGLTAREAATIELAFIQAAFTAGLMDAGSLTEVPKDVNAENVKLVQANRAEIATLTALVEREEQ